MVISGLNTWPAVPLSTLPHSLAGRRGMTRVRVDCSSLPVEDFHLLFHAGYPALSPINPPSGLGIVKSLATFLQLRAEGMRFWAYKWNRGREVSADRDWIFEVVAHRLMPTRMLR